MVDLKMKIQAANGSMQYLGTSIAINPKFLVSFNAMLPVLRDVNGLQLTTTWMGNLGISYVLN